MKVNLPKLEKNKNSTGPNFIRSPIKLTVSLLVSNQIGTIRKCMESLKPILDAVPSELIVVDTVGPENSDGSLAIAKEYADQVIRFEWCDDFAAARNAGLSRAKGEWFLYVDDDEWFEDPTEIVAFFQSGEYEKYGCTQYAVRSYEDEEMTRYSDGWVTRLARRTPEMKFIHPIHEMLSPVYKPEKKFLCYAHHVGYIFKNKEEKKEHFHRNVYPLLEEIEKHPNDLRLMMQLIQEYIFNGEYEKAKEYCHRAETANDDPLFDAIWNWIVTALIKALILQERKEEAMEESRRLLELPRTNDLAKLNITYLMGNAAESLQDYETMMECAKEYHRLAQYFDEHQDKMLEQVMLSQGDILMEDRRKAAYRAMFLSCKKLERYEELCTFAEGISWDKEYMKDKLYLLLLLEAADKTDRYDIIARTVEKLLAQGEIPEEFQNALQQVCNSSDGDRKYQWRKTLAGIESDDPYFLTLKAWCTQQDGGDVAAALQECLDHGVDCAAPRQDLLLVCLKAGFDPTPFLAPLYLEDWVAAFHLLVKEMSIGELQELLRLADQILYPASQEKFYFLAKLIYQKILVDVETPGEKLWEEAGEYIRYTMAYSQNLYREEMFAPDQRSNLPREVLFALSLKEARDAKDKQDWKQAFAMLKECVRAYPPNKELVNRLVDQIQTDMEAEQEQFAQFAEMATKIKQSIHQMIGSGQVLEARGVLDQLKALMPQDPEIQDLEKKVSMSERLNDLTTLMH